jgi:hypothetical protein
MVDALADRDPDAVDIGECWRSLGPSWSRRERLPDQVRDQDVPALGLLGQDMRCGMCGAGVGQLVDDGAELFRGHGLTP